jgi:Na+/glutamate symporter
MDTASTPNTDDHAWPGVETAYDFVVPSYQMLMSRFEAADNRLTALITFASSITLGGPLFAKAVRPDIDFNSPAFWIGMACATLGVICGVIGRIHGRIILPNPTVMYDKSLRDSQWTFKKDAIFFAGQNFTANVAVVDAKGRYATVLTIAILIEVWMFTIWVVA